jgi:hypothetical protein
VSSSSFDLSLSLLSPSPPLLPFLSPLSFPSSLSSRSKGDLRARSQRCPLLLFPRMALSDSKLLFVNGKPPLKSIHFDAITDKDRVEQPVAAPTAAPSLFGVPLKYISYVLLSVSPTLPTSNCGPIPFLVLFKFMASSSDLFPSQFGHSSRSKCYPFTAHALLARLYAAVTCIFRSIRSPSDRAPEGSHITAYCIDSCTTYVISACLCPSFPASESPRQLSA